MEEHSNESLNGIIGIAGPITLPKVKEELDSQDELRGQEEFSALEIQLLISKIKEEKEPVNKAKEEKTLEEVAEEEAEEVEDSPETNISYGFTNSDRFARIEYTSHSFEEASFYGVLDGEVASSVYQQQFGDEAYSGSIQNQDAQGVMSESEAEATIHDMMYEAVTNGGAQDLSNKSAEERERFSNWLLDPFNKKVLLNLYQTTNVIQSNDVNYQ